MNYSEQSNRGIKLKFYKANTAQGAVTEKAVTRVQSYSVQWERETESFQKWDMSTCTIFKGDRFTADITTGLLTDAEMTSLRDFLLKKHDITMYCPEFPEGSNHSGGITVNLTSLSQPVEVSNYNSYGTTYYDRTFYRMSFSVAAVGLQNGGSL